MTSSENIKERFVKYDPDRPPEQFKECAVVNYVMEAVQKSVKGFAYSAIPPYAVTLTIISIIDVLARNQHALDAFHYLLRVAKARRRTTEHSQSETTTKKGSTP